MGDISGLGSSWSNLYSNDYSYLFNGLSGNSTTSTTTRNILGIDLAEYASVTRGSYSKLVKAYYEKYGNSGSSSGTNKTSDKSEKLEQTTLKGNANDLYKAANALVTSGVDSVFKKIDIRDEETGKTSKGYDKDKIYEAVSSLVEAYNSMVGSSTESSDNSILRQTLHMVNSVSANSSLLSDVGIRVGSDNKLSIDEETFKNSDMSIVKTLLNGNHSLGGKIQSAASNLYVRLSNYLSDKNTYTASGTLGSYSTGNMLDNFL